MTKLEKEWIKGYACACQVAANLQGMPDDGLELMNQGGFTKERFIEAGVDQNDLDILFPKEEKWVSILPQEDFFVASATPTGWVNLKREFMVVRKNHPTQRRMFLSVNARNIGASASAFQANRRSHTSSEPTMITTIRTGKKMPRSFDYDEALTLFLTGKYTNAQLARRFNMSDGDMAKAIRIARKERFQREHALLRNA